jgi:hypothetical protein
VITPGGGATIWAGRLRMTDSGMRGPVTVLGGAAFASRDTRRA